MIRLRIHYSKTQALRYTSNLDVHKIWERALRRARLPLAYSQGFHPQPKLNQACPLPLGILSYAEMIDIWLEQEMQPEQVLHDLAPALPAGLEISAITPVDLKSPPLPTRVVASHYTATLLTPVSISDLSSSIEQLLADEKLPRQWRNKAYDLRPLILELSASLSHPEARPLIHMVLSAREGATGRPEEVLSALGYDPFNARIERTRLILSDEG